jgi:hypothetical protein
MGRSGRLEIALGDPGGVGGFVGALVQIAGLLIAVPASVAAVRSLAAGGGSTA